MDQHQLMIWPEANRGIPNALARSALFNVDNIRSAGERAWLKEAIIASDDCITIKYTGEQLRQDDADVWLQLVHMTRDQLNTKTLTFTCRSMLNAIGWNTKNADSKKRLIATIQRLFTAALNIDGPRQGYAGHLINSFKWTDWNDHENKDIELREWTVTLNQELVNLYALTHYTRIDWETRLGLSPLAKWLHCDVLSHRTPWPISLTRLHEMCGSKCNNPKKWRDLVQAAMAALLQAKVIHTFEIKNSALSWTRQGDSLHGYSLP